MTDSSARFVATAVLAMVVLVAASIALFLSAVAVRLTLGPDSGAWGVLALIGGTFALTLVGTWWIVRRVMRRG